MHPPAHDRDRHAGRPHVEEFGALLTGLVDLAVDIREGPREFLTVERAAEIGGDPGEFAGDHLAGHPATAVAAHSVGDGKEPYARHEKDAVFVGRPVEPDVGTSRRPHQAGLRRRRRRFGRGEARPANRSP